MSLVSNDDILAYLQAGEGITVPTAGQTLITLIQPMVEAEIKRVLGSDVEQATYTENYPEGESNTWVDGDQLVVGFDYAGGQVLPRNRGDRALATVRLRNLPVRSITSVYENPSAWASGSGSFPSTTLLDSASYHLDLVSAGLSRTGKLYKTAGLWTSVPRCIQVTYVAGWTSGEITSNFPQIKLATLIAVAYEYASASSRSSQAQMGGQIGGVSIEGFSISLNQDAVGGYGNKIYALPPEVTARLAPWINLHRYIGV